MTEDALAPTAVRQRAAPYRKTRRPIALTSAGVEGLALFSVCFAVYGLIGYRLVIQQHVVVFDALARLSHAYFVWFNEPPKLAAVGFVWPPVSTLVFLPFAAVKPLATSMLALPLTSAFFAALLVTFLNRVFRLADMPRWLRLPILAAFAANPMIVFYATNGMSEVVYLFFLVASIYFFFRWYLERSSGVLVLAAVFFAFGILSRYEVITWAILISSALVVALIRQHVTRLELEGTIIAYLAPVSYGVGLWVFFNWLILNDPLFFLKQQAPGGGGSPGRENPGLNLTIAGERMEPLEILRRLVELNWQLFPLTLGVLALLVGLFVVRRDLMGLTLASVLALNAAFTGLIVFVSRAESYLQLRYNMRAIPIALVGVAWLYLSVRSPRLKTAVAASTVAVLVASIPGTWRIMQTYPIQYLEQAFTRAVATGEDQEGTASVGGYTVGIKPNRDMARFIAANVTGRDAILTDDAQTFSIMLLSGRPGLFLDRIDYGDGVWLDLRDRPFGRIPYVLVTGSPNDLVLQKYPRLQTGEQPGFRVVHREGSLVLLRVLERAPQEDPAPTSR